MKDTKIEWCDHTVNFWWGCTKVSPACGNCYAETLAKMWSQGKATWGPGGARWLREAAARRELRSLDNAAEDTGKRQRIFINSMSDTFEDHPALPEERAAMLAMIAGLQHLDILLLTKRPENVLRMVPAAWLENWPAHVWIGTTVENQAMALERIPRLLEIPAKVRFLSCEPLLGEIDLFHDDLLAIYPYHAICQGLQWVICGGESGPKARPMSLAWARRLRDLCSNWGVPFFFKQWGEWVPLPEPAPPDAELVSVEVGGRKRRVLQVGNEVHVRLGKTEAGRVFDGVVHNAFPVTR